MKFLKPSPTFDVQPSTLPSTEGLNFSKTRARLGLSSNNYKACNSYRGASRCAMEWDMWMMVNAFITPLDTVIEFGARYGTTSCVIAAATNKVFMLLTNGKNMWHAGVVTTACLNA